MRQKISEYAKLIAALIGAAVTAFTTQIPAEWQGWATSIAAFLTAAAVLLVPNAPTARQRDMILAKHAVRDEADRDADIQFALGRVQSR